MTGPAGDTSQHNQPDCRCSCHRWSSLDVAACPDCYDGQCRAAVVAGRDTAGGDQ